MIIAVIMPESPKHVHVQSCLQSLEKKRKENEHAFMEK